MRHRKREIPTNKFSRDYNYYLKSCLTKKAYDTENEAINNAIGYGVHYESAQDVYKCEFCGKFHITTHTGDKWNSFHVTGDGGEVVLWTKNSKSKKRMLKRSFIKNRKNKRKNGENNGK